MHSNSSIRLKPQTAGRILLFFGAGMAVWMPSVRAQTGTLDTKDPSTATAQDPATPKTSRLELGFLSNQRRGEKDSSYYRLEHLGETLAEKGTPLTLQDINKPNVAPDPADPGGDTKALVIRLERGLVNTTGALFSTLGVKQLMLPGGLFKDLRGAAQLSGQADGDQINFALGLETKPFHPVKYIGLKVPNWFVVGLQGEAQDTESGNKDLALATFRTYIGQGFRWVESNELLQLRETLTDQVLGLERTFKVKKTINVPTLNGPVQGEVEVDERVVANTYASAMRLKPDINQRILAQKPVSVPEHILRAIVDLLEARGVSTTDADSPAFWQAEVDQFTKAYTDIPDQPTYTLQAESAGWYTLSGQNGPRHFNAIFAVTGRYYLNPRASDQSYLQVRYENGFDRAAPSVRKHFVAVTAGYSF